MQRYYTGIGSRSTPVSVKPLFIKIAMAMADKGFILRSGRAEGADTYFELGAGKHAELYRPTKSWVSHTPQGAPIYVPTGELFEKALLLASTVHPAWGACNEYTRLLHARNTFQIYGQDLNIPSDLVIAYAEELKPDVLKGGTGVAWAMAKASNIPRFNLYMPGELARLREHFKIL